jgi:hypothetical protein
MTVPRFLDASGIGRTKFYELVDAGQLETATIGRRRLVILESYRKLLHRS